MFTFFVPEECDEGSFKASWVTLVLPRQAFLISVLCFLHLFEKTRIEPQIYAFLHVFQWSLTQVVPGA